MPLRRLRRSCDGVAGEYLGILDDGVAAQTQQSDYFVFCWVLWACLTASAWSSERAMMGPTGWRGLKATVIRELRQ